MSSSQIPKVTTPSISFKMLCVILLEGVGAVIALDDIAKSSLSHLPAVLLPVLFLFHWWMVLQMATIPDLHISDLRCGSLSDFLQFRCSAPLKNKVAALTVFSYSRGWSRHFRGWKLVTEIDCWYLVIQNQCAAYSLVFHFLSVPTVVREYQTEVIVVPALLVGLFVIILSVILWLHCRGLRAKQEQSAPAGTQGKKNAFQSEERVLVSVARSQFHFPLAWAVRQYHWWGSWVIFSNPVNIRKIGNPDLLHFAAVIVEAVG